MAEDETLIARYLQRILEQAGATVTVVRRVSQVLDHAGLGYDCALLDVSLEDGDVFPGAEVLAKNIVPIVFHSGHDQPTLRMRQGLRARLLDKPARPQEIVQTIQEQIADLAQISKATASSGTALEVRTREG